MCLGKMIGKLQSWRGGDNGRSKEWRHSGVGGLVSIEDLAKKPKSPPAAKPANAGAGVPEEDRGAVSITSMFAWAVEPAFIWLRNYMEWVFLEVRITLSLFLFF